MTLYWNKKHKRKHLHPRKVAEFFTSMGLKRVSAYGRDLNPRIYLLALIPWLFVIIMSLMAFDAGVSTWNISLVAILIAYPIAVIICSLGAWMLYQKHARTSVYVNLIPALWFIGAAVAFSVPW